MSSYTCLACRVFFTGKDANGEQCSTDTNFDSRAAALQKAHYKTDWHRYNVKRKVAGLPPVTVETFNEKVLEQQKKLAEESKVTVFRCDACGKKFSSGNTYANHMQSKKHKNAETSGLPVRQAVPEEVVVEEVGAEADVDMTDVTQDDDDGEWEDVDEEGEEETLGPNDCLFCPKAAKSLNANIIHMSRVHSFFIPDVEYIHDMEGLVTNLGEQITQMGMCLWCKLRGRVFANVKSVQQHMTDKGHCRLLYEGEARRDYAAFYDYSPKISMYRKKRVVEPGEEGGVEEGESTSDVYDDDDSFAASVGTFDNPTSLVLPSGATAGHRSLLPYFRQYRNPGQALALISNNSSSISKIIAHYKALGCLGTTGAAAKKKSKDMSHVYRWNSYRSMHLGVKANKLQHHFRDDNFGCH